MQHIAVGLLSAREIWASQWQSQSSLMSWSTGFSFLATDPRFQRREVVQTWISWRETGAEGIGESSGGMAGRTPMLGLQPHHIVASLFPESHKPLWTAETRERVYTQPSHLSPHPTLKNQAHSTLHLVPAEGASNLRDIRDWLWSRAITPTFLGTWLVFPETTVFWQTPPACLRGAPPYWVWEIFQYRNRNMALGLETHSPYSLKSECLPPRPSTPCNWKGSLGAQVGPSYG